MSTESNPETSENTFVLDENLKKKLEAVLFLENKLIEARRLAKLGGLEETDLEVAIAELNKAYAETGSVFRVIKLETAYQLTIDKTFKDPVIDPYIGKKKKLSKAVLETLAIVAYKQPVTKPEVDNIRGVNCSNYIRQLLEDSFIQIAGKKNIPGKPNMYRTTPKFLLHFGLASIKDLPSVKEVKSYEFLEEMEIAEEEKKENL